MLLHTFWFFHLLVRTASLMPSARLQGLTPVHVGGSQSALSIQKPELPVNSVKPNVVKPQGTHGVVVVAKEISTVSFF